MPCTSHFRCTAICVAKVRYLFITAKEIAEKDDRPRHFLKLHRQVPRAPSTWNRMSHLCGTVYSTYVELYVSSMWNSLSHVRGTVCFIYVEPCVPRTWNCAFHIHGTLVKLRFIRTHSVQRNCRSRAARCSHTCGRFPRCLLVVRA